MAIIITLAPWMVFWALAPYSKIFTAAGTALCLSFLINLRNILSGNTKVLPVGAFIFFLALTIASVTVRAPWFFTWAHTIANAAVTLTAIVSILIGKPFVLQYARDRVSKERWNSPKLFHESYVLSWMWVAFFGLMILTSSTFALLPSLPQWISTAIHWALFVIAMSFSYWYRAKCRKTC